jgi:hypothetical protein
VQRLPYVMTNQGLQIDTNITTEKLLQLRLNCFQTNSPDERAADHGDSRRSPIIIGLVRQTEDQDKYWKRDENLDFHSHAHASTYGLEQEQSQSPIYVRQEGL